MGVVGTKPDHERIDSYAAAVIEQGRAGRASTPARTAQLPFFTHFVAACNAHRGIVLQRFTAETFARVARAELPRVRESWQRTGNPRYVHRSIYFEVLQDEMHAKMFKQHMRGLEALSFIAMPGVTVPRAAIITDRGQYVACMTLHHLFAPVPADARPTHVATARAVLSKVLRLRNDPALVLWDGGDGSIIAVDATFLLPTLTLLAPSNVKLAHQMRPELAITRDCSWPAVTAPVLAHAAGESVALPFLSAVVASAPSGKKRASPCQFLHAVLAAGHPGCETVDEKLRPVSIPTHAAPTASWSVGWEEISPDDAVNVTRVAVQVALQAAVERMETLGEEFSVSDVMHGAGLGMHMLGAVWNALGTGHAAPQARQRVAVELVARGGKHWLAQQLAAGNEATAGATMLELYRTVHDSNFVRTHLVPIITHRYGELEPSLVGLPLPLRLISSRLRDLTGVTVANGVVGSVEPRIRVARSEFKLSPQHEFALASVAVKRDDPMGVAAVLAAAGLHARTANRISGVVTQLRGRRIDNPVLQLFVTFIELIVVETHLRNNAITEAVTVLDKAVSGLLDIVTASNTEHDKRFGTRQGLRLVGFFTRLKRAPNAHAYMVKLLSIGALADLSTLGVVACRQMLEEYYRAATEAFANRGADALHIAQTWARMCGSLFGPASAQQCRATKLLLVGLVRCRKHQEALAVAEEYMALAIRAFGSFEVHAAMATNDVATLTWRRDPRRGLMLYQRALDVFRQSPAGRQQVGSTLYNMGLAATRLNKLRQAVGYFSSSREAALAQGERSTVEACERMKRAVIDIAATKIQRWVRDCMYGVAPSQTSRTDLCSTLTWSEKDEVLSTAGDILHSSALIDGGNNSTSGESAGSFGPEEEEV